MILMTKQPTSRRRRFKLTKSLRKRVRMSLIAQRYFELQRLRELVRAEMATR
jgi:hypothetical protein